MVPEKYNRFPLICPRQESNLDHEFRKLAFYPLNYEDNDRPEGRSQTQYHETLKTQIFHDELQKRLMLLFLGDVWLKKLSNVLRVDVCRINRNNHEGSERLCRCE